MGLDDRFSQFYVAKDWWPAINGNGRIDERHLCGVGGHRQKWNCEFVNISLHKDYSVVHCRIHADLPCKSCSMRNREV